MFDEIIETLKNADNEITESPYWLILDPEQNMRRSVDCLASQITGPFFSRVDAQAHLDSRKHAYSKRARVYCHSGYWSHKYKTAYRAIRSGHEGELTNINPPTFINAAPGAANNKTNYSHTPLNRDTGGGFNVTTHNLQTESGEGGVR